MESCPGEHVGKKTKFFNLQNMLNKIDSMLNFYHFQKFKSVEILFFYSKHFSSPSGLHFSFSCRFGPLWTCWCLFFCYFKWKQKLAKSNLQHLPVLLAFLELQMTEHWETSSHVLMKVACYLPWTCQGKLSWTYLARSKLRNTPRKSFANKTKEEVTSYSKTKTKRLGKSFK